MEHVRLTEGFETIGNATIQVFQDGRPVLATDPWLTGTCYFGSWALDHPLTEQQITNVVNSKFIWISHGHPDHLHEPSLDLLPKGKRVLLPDHYDNDIHSFLRDKGFDVTVLPYRRWHQLGPGLRVMCLDNINQDAILIIQVGEFLLINLNDSPVAGEDRFLRRLVARFPCEKTYVFALCSVDADMCNLVDEHGRSTLAPPEERKVPEIWRVARLARKLGVGTFCCSSSQHVYARSDSAWANAHRITWDDMRRHWSQPEVRLVPPFSTVELTTGAVTQNHPTHQPDPDQFSDTTGDDDWDATLSEDEWRMVTGFFARFELLPKHMDYLDITVGGVTRRVNISNRGRQYKGMHFFVPKQSLMATVTSGYFDDLLIGNFMKVSLSNMRLYPFFTPLVAKIGGNAKVYTRKQYLRFLSRYFLRNAPGSAAYMAHAYFYFQVLPTLGRMSRSLKLQPQIKQLYHRMLGNPIRR